MLSLEKAVALVTKLERTRGFPRDSDGVGVENLARGLQKASDSLRIAGARIVDRCAETSEYCPTDSDLLTVARDIARLDSLATGTFDSMANAANHASAAKVTECPLCHGDGWEIRWYLHTREGGDRRSYIRKERITEEQAKALSGKLDPQTQAVYSGAKRCTCPVAPDSFAELTKAPEPIRPRSQLGAAADWARKASGERE